MNVNRGWAMERQANDSSHDVQSGHEEAVYPDENISVRFSSGCGVLQSKIKETHVSCGLSCERTRHYEI